MGFLDAGIEALADNLGKGWTSLMSDWFNEAAAKDTGPASKFVTPEEAAAVVGRMTAANADIGSILTDFKAKYRSNSQASGV